MALREQSGSSHAGRLKHFFLTFALVFVTAASAADLPDPPDSPKDTRDRAGALLDDDLPGEEAAAPSLRGFYQFEGAYTLPSPGHWSKLMNRLEVGSQGQFTGSVKWKATVRTDYDAIYASNDYYASDVRRDQRFNFLVRETYLDGSAGAFDLRVGRQQIVWGEVVGLFFADVVSAKDLRESVLQNFDTIRIPQWAARGEYFVGDTHFEAIWIPIATVDEIGKPGSNFYPYPPAGPAGYGYFVNDERRPKHDWSTQNFGLRASSVYRGWDGSLFAYRSVDTEPTFLREIVNRPIPTFVFTPVHQKITQYGATVSKDLDDFVLKAEAVYTVGRAFNVSRLDAQNGVVRQNFLDYIVSLDFPLPSDDRLNLQAFQRWFTHHDMDIVPRRAESGASVQYSRQMGKFTPSILAIHSLNHNDWLLRPKVTWAVDKDWRVAGGADILGGHRNGFFGQYDKQDRVYVEVKRAF